MGFLMGKQGNEVRGKNASAVSKKTYGIRGGTCQTKAVPS